MEKSPESCILCGSLDRSLLVRQGSWTVFRCTGCGLGVLDPRPDKEEREKLYRSDYFLDQYDRGLPVGSPELQRRIGQEDHRIRFFRPFRRKGHVLDIGCGMGYFLYACRQAGYEVRGIDLSEASAQYVRNELQIPVTTGDIDGIDIPDNSLDVITMWHFLEHTADPRQYLAQASRWLKPAGLIVVDVPNYEGTDAKKTWGAWKGWQLPYHLYHFTPGAVIALLNRSGFQILRKKDYLSEYMREKLELMPLVRMLARPLAALYSGHSFAVVARKRAS